MSAKQAAALIVALDNCSPDEARKLVATLAEAGVEWFKVGLELYTQAGPDFVRDLKKQGYKVFLDLKLHDIPNTVEKAVTVAKATGADLLTVHASGGPEMLKAALKGAAGSQLSILAVTVLTSLDGESMNAVSKAWGAITSQGRLEKVRALAQLAAEAGVTGIVCSPADLKELDLRKLPWSKTPIFVTPGIRNSGDAKNDQKSTTTAKEAVEAGSTHLVVGRPITAPANGTQQAAAKTFLAEIKGAR